MSQKPRTRILPIFAILFVSICLFPTEKALPADGNSCFFVEGRPICGREGEIAREKHANMVANLVAQQQDRHLRADPDELPQGDDPRFESRVAYTGQANTNDKGQSRPIKGEPVPAPTTTPCTTTPKPCPTTTTTTTPAPCPLMTTTPKPLTPCEKARLEQQMRSNPYIMMADEPAQDLDRMMADQPVPQAVIADPVPNDVMSDQPIGHDDHQPQFQDQYAQVQAPTPSPSQSYFQQRVAPSQYAQLGQFRGEPATLDSNDDDDTSASGNSLMRSRLPEAVRGSNRGRLSLYHTFMEPSRSYHGDAQRNDQHQDQDYSNDDPYGYY